MRSSVKRGMTLVAALALVFTLFAGGSAYAFSDIQHIEGKEHILKLKLRGILKGDGKNMFHPRKSLDAASAITLLVRSFDLKVEPQNGKMPKASDYFTKIHDRAWYAKAFLAAHLNGIEMARDINPTASVSREQFAKWLYQAIETTGERVWIMLYREFADEDQVSEGYMDAIQRLINADIVTLDSKNRFHPKKAITRAEAAVWVERALEFTEKTPPVTPVPKDPVQGVLKDVALAVEKVNDDVLKVTVSATAPHPGYGIEVSSIEFQKDQAVIHYRVVQPDPDQFYAHVLTTVKAETYVSAKYKPVLGNETPVLPHPKLLPMAN